MMLITYQYPYIGKPCPKAPEPKDVHLFCYSGNLREGPWETVAKCQWCGITPVGEVTKGATITRAERGTQ